MQDYYNQQPDGTFVLEGMNDGVNRYIAKVFGWMFLGLIVTALTTGILVHFVASFDALIDFLFSSIHMFFIVFLGQIILVHAINSRVSSMGTGLAKILYIIYAITNGFTVGVIVAIYAMYIIGIATVAMAFAITAISFGVMAIYGYATKSDITRFSNLFIMGLVGVILASVANIFMGNSMLDFAICVVGLLIFLGLVAVDTNKIKNHFAYHALNSYNQDGTINEEQYALASNLAIVGALMLYLDFINMFLFILRLFSRRR